MNKNIVLIGMPGSGKTTIGKEVAKRLQIPFIDMDEMIEKKEGKVISEIFDYGEEHFRNLETNCAKELSNRKLCVISTGGGIVKRKENIELLKINSIIVFINRSPEKIVSDVDIQKRPLLKNGIENVYKIYNERIDLYKKYCDLEILNDDTIESAVNKIVNSINKREIFYEY